MRHPLGLIGITLAFLLLLFGTGLVFHAFDQHSHSASDTLRPFIITMAPVWFIAIAGAWAIFHRNSSVQHGEK
jgi:hypothetical protein